MRKIDSHTAGNKLKKLTTSPRIPQIFRVFLLLFLLLSITGTALANPLEPMILSQELSKILRPTIPLTIAFLGETLVIVFVLVLVANNLWFFMLGIIWPLITYCTYAVSFSLFLLWTIFADSIGFLSFSSFFVFLLLEGGIVIIEAIIIRSLYYKGIRKLVSTTKELKIAWALAASLLGNISSFFIWINLSRFSI